MAYDEREIVNMLNGLNRGNPGRDAQARSLLKQIADNPTKSGLSDETLTLVRRALER